MVYVNITIFKGEKTMNIILMLLLVAVVGYVAYRSKGEDYFLTTSESNMNLGLSYGATLISTSAIIGFGGLAGWIGFSIPLTMVIPLRWLNLFCDSIYWSQST